MKLTRSNFSIRRRKGLSSRIIIAQKRSCPKGAIALIVILFNLDAPELAMMWFGSEFLSHMPSSYYPHLYRYRGGIIEFHTCKIEHNKLNTVDHFFF